MLELSNDTLTFAFPDIHPEAKCSISFVRTLRIPDDDKTYPLPPGLGSFPMRHVDDFKDRVPAKWLQHGGVMLPMYQSEAMWLKFTGHNVRNQGIYPFAIKIAAGKRSAVTGKAWSKTLKEKDYCVIPKQPWLDGYVIDGDTIRQFVAAPLGAGFSAEEQITGKAEFGGVQIEVIPMKREVFDRRFPVQKPRGYGMGARMRSAGAADDDDIGDSNTNYSLSLCDSMPSERRRMKIADIKPDMALAPGGKMKQTVYEDPYDFADWDTDNHSRVFVHLANSLAWRAITKHDPPTAPRTSADYTAYGFPWFDYYDDSKGLKGTATLKGLKSVMELGFQKGLGILPENESVTIKSDKVVKIKAKDGVRDGNWSA